MRIFTFIFALALMFSFCKDASAEQISVSAQSAILIETSSDKIVYEKNAYAKLPMASTTKIMTALCAIENSYTNKIVEVDKRAVGTEGSSIYLAYGEKISVRDLLYGLLLHSGNDAAEALAYAVSGSREKFVDLMNKTAKKIGAENTHFTNPSGLYDDEHYTTSHDLALIASYAMKNELFAKIVSTKSAKISNGDKGYDRILSNHNKLLRLYPGCIGVKTGYTKKCGRCLVSCARRDGVTLICVTLNDPDDWNDHMKLFDFGFSVCNVYRVASSGDYAMKLGVSGGSKKYCTAEFADSLEDTCVNSDMGKISIKYDLPGNLKAPVRSGQKIGRASLLSDGKQIDSADLICRDSAVAPEKASFKETLGENIKKYLFSE